MKAKLILSGLCLLFGSVSHGQQTYLHCGKLITCADQTLREAMTIVVEGDKIMEVRKGYATAPEGAKVIDLKNRTVMPGLMDMHVHIESESSRSSYMERTSLNEADRAFKAAQYANRTLMAGFTTVRDLGGTGVNVSLRNAINQGIAIGPRIITCEKSIATTGGHADPTNGLNRELMGDPGPDEGVVNGPDEARKAVRQRYKNGADCIKITATGGVLSVAKDGQGPQFVDEELDAIIQTAKDYGMHTAAHAHGTEGMLRAVKAGITSIEHGTMMTPEVMELMKQKGTYYVPTISAGKFVAEKAKEEGYFPKIIALKALAVGPQIQATFAAAYKAGVKIAFGTDSGVSPHGNNGKEFVYMVEAGMPAIEAIFAATVTTSKLIGMNEQLGSIEAGKFADIVAIEGDPLVKIDAMLNVRFVMKNGVVYKNE